MARNANLVPTQAQPHTAAAEDDVEQGTLVDGGNIHKPRLARDALQGPAGAVQRIFMPSSNRIPGSRFPVPSSPVSYIPLNCASRFSRKACVPSFASSVSVVIVDAMASNSSISSSVHVSER